MLLTCLASYVKTLNAGGRLLAGLSNYGMCDTNFDEVTAWQLK